MRSLLGNQTTCVNQSLGMMSVNSILITCVRIWPQDLVYKMGLQWRNAKTQGNGKSSSNIWKALILDICLKSKLFVERVSLKRPLLSGITQFCTKKTSIKLWKK